MNELELEQYLYEHIPLSLVMQVSVIGVREDGVTLRAPLAPNINHTSTIFGGSASAVAILSAWSLVHVYMKNAGIACSIVIQRNSMAYEKPIYGSFTARSSITEPALLALFMRTLLRRGRARISVSSLLEYEGKIVGKFEGDFVVTKAN
ncbi:MAG: YiiD C-terminal domain-containing protein [Methylotenera sp.]|nr:YiiD C-terminal domain-containing protein [Methylotenera sp.]